MDRGWIAFAVLIAVPLCAGPDREPVEVEIIEDLPAGSELGPGDRPASTRYREPAFGFASIPARYSPGALPLDRSSPFVLRASLEGALEAGEYQFRLRSKGAARFLVDGKAALSTRPQRPNGSGDDPVPPPAVRGDSPLRPVPHPHQEEVATVRLEGGLHRFVLVAVIGGKGLAPAPGELSVSVGRPGEVPRLLGGEEAPELTDDGWEAYAARSKRRHRLLDVERRRAAGKEAALAWEAYHRRVREWMQDRPAPRAPAVSPGTPVLNDIDRYLGAALEAAPEAAPEAARIEPLPLASDLEFLRRLSLDTIGIIPLPDAVRRFLEDPPGERRSRAIDRLLAHAGWADHWVSYWQDVLAENPGFLKPDLNNTGPFRWWLHQCFADGYPYDRMVVELVEMGGSSQQGGPAGFGVATLNDAPLAAKADILCQAFLGEKLSCARCHDAPFQRFEQRDLFGLAAMLAGKPLVLPASSTVPAVEGFRKPQVPITLRAGERIEPRWPFEELVEAAGKGGAEPPPVPAGAGPESRHRLAALIVDPRNQRFAQVAVNRVWKRLLGLGLVEPVDEWSSAKPSHPELLAHLAREFVLGGYDLKHVARLIFSSHAYQRRPVGASPGKLDRAARLFAGPLRRRLSAEQLVDSLHRAAGKGFRCEELNLNPAGDRGLEQFLNMGTPQRAWEMTALSNERDRPALALPLAQSIVDVLAAFGWRQARQFPASVRDDAPSPAQTLLLANGILGARIVRLSEDGAFTELCLADGLTLPRLVEETFLRVLTREPSERERRAFEEHLAPAFAGRRLPGAPRRAPEEAGDRRVSWSNHLSAEATLIRMEEERRLRQGDAPTSRLSTDFRERFEDFLWALVNSPEMMLVP